MPNHVTNELHASRCVLDALKGSKSCVDFNSIIPRPDCFDCEPCSFVVDWANLVMGTRKLSEMQAKAVAAGRPVDRFLENDFRSASDVLHYQNVMRMLAEGPFIDTDRDLNDFISCCKALKETGYAFWFDWCIAKWGTKWNAYDAEDRGDCVRFATAWSPPTPFIKALAKRFQDERIEFSWADEDSGYNVGSFSVINGVVTGGPIADCSPEAWALWLRLKHDGVCPEDMRALPNGSYEYIET